MKKLSFLSLVTVAMLALGWSSAMAQDVVEVTTTSPQVTQDFDGMWDATAGEALLNMPQGWRVDRNMTGARMVGAYSSAATSVMYTGGTSLASNAKNGTWNFQSSSTPSDCSVGGLSTTVDGGTRCINVMTCVKNSGDEAITKLTLGYDIEKYRDGDNPAGFAVQLYTSTDGTNWTSAGDDFYTYFAPDAATAGAASVPISTTAINGKQLKVSIAAGEQLYLAWNISVASGSSPNKAMGLSIDNVVIDATFASQDLSAYIYVEDVTKWSALYMNGSLPESSAVVNGVNYKVWAVDMDGASHTLAFTDGGSNSQTTSITANRDYYLCLTSSEVTEIANPENYTGWVDPSRPPFVASGIYLRGEVNSWGAVTDWEFSDEGEGTYVLYDKTLSGAFKVADANWSSACNYGSNGTSVMIDTPYALVLGTNDNISCGGNTYVCKKIILTIANGSATLLLQSDDDETGLTSVYVMGDNNGWNYMDASGELTLTENNIFTGQVTMNAGDDGYCHWRIYQRLGMVGVWGAESDLTGDNTSGTLVKGSTGTVSTAAGTYDVTFNLTTGEFSLVKSASTATTMTLQPADVVLVPELPEQIKVLSLNNSLIYYNDQDAVFNAIAAAMGKNATWTKHTLLGKSLRTHWDEGDGVAEDGNPGAKMLVRSEAWSHIILQEQSSLPRTDIETFRANVKRWVDYIREYCPNPNAIIIVPINWAYSGDWANYTAFNNTFLKNYQDVALDLGVTLCPVGLAYQAVFDTEGATGTNTWFLDDRHPTLKATYMAAAMEYGLIFGEDPAAITYAPSDLSGTDATSMRTYASNALNGFTNYVDHTAGKVHYKVTVRDQYGMEIEPAEPVVMTLSDGGNIDENNVFTSNGTNGTFTVNATTGNFSADATVKVATAETEVVVYPAIELNEETLSASQDFDAIGDAATATLPDAWRIDRILTAPRTVGRFDMADTHTMYSGGVNLASNAKNGTWNFGADDTSDRALGGISTGVADATRCVNLYAHLLNTGRKNIENVNVAYNVEKYRKGSNAAGFAVQLYYSIDGRNWTSAGDKFRTYFAPDSETAGYASVPGETVAVSDVLDVPISRGCDLYLAWNITVASGDAANAAMAIGIDDFSVSGELPTIPASNYYIYVDDQTGWDALGLYAWGDSELFGSWPGEASVGEVSIDDSKTVYKVFLLNTEGGNYNLIFNNWNNGKQLPDYNITANRDYYFRIDENGVTELDVVSVVENVVDGKNAITVSGNVASFPGMIEVYNINGQRVAAGSNTLSLGSLAKGIYILRATDGKQVTSLKVAR
ncbi:MAG: T9SS type A sorting domain-containing protein [Muribaculaceae bacterium]|nr:T9SS type A sorting domain-containing protein [Muribaculaceae bacterium]